LIVRQSPEPARRCNSAGAPGARPAARSGMLTPVARTVGPLSVGGCGTAGAGAGAGGGVCAAAAGAAMSEARSAAHSTRATRAELMSWRTRRIIA
jgi:hypothetical protein